jgi:hypothetical protein
MYRCVCSLCLSHLLRLIVSVTRACLNLQKKAEDAVKVIVEIKEEVEKVRLALKEEEKRRIETMKALKSVCRVCLEPMFTLVYSSIVFLSAVILIWVGPAPPCVTNRRRCII